MQNNGKPAVQEDLNHILKARRDKLTELQAKGQDPFVITTYQQTHHSQEIKDGFDGLEGKEVRTLSLKESEGTKEEAIEGIDYLLVFYGIISENPTFPLHSPRSIDFQGYLHDDVQETSRNLFVIGDCSLKDREEKRLLPGFREAAIVAGEIKRRLS